MMHAFVSNGLDGDGWAMENAYTKWANQTILNSTSEGLKLGGSMTLASFPYEKSEQNCALQEDLRFVYMGCIIHRFVLSAFT